jgi:hypothetical protein
MSKAPPDLFGRGSVERSLLAILPRPRPEQVVVLATLTVEEVCVNGRCEGGIVELEREVVAAFLRALRPGGTYLH